MNWLRIAVCIFDLMIFTSEVALGDLLYIISTKPRLPGVPKEQFDYMPHPEFVEHMKDLLRIYKKPKEVSAGEEGNIRRMKNYYLPLIFQAMADLSFFFEATAQNPELRKEYQLPIMELLGVKRLNPRKNLHGFMFRNLVSGMLAIGDNEDDFRLRFVHYLEELIWYKVQGLRILGTDKPSSLASQRASTRIIDEIGRPMVWTELLASRVPDVYRFDILRHGIEDHEKYPYGGTEKQRNKAFEEDANRKKPERTFPFDTEKEYNLVNK